jgi:hypothetical protein
MHVGRAVGADEVVDVDAAEIWVTLGEDADHTATLAGVRDVVRGYPGLRSAVRAYADDRVSAVSASTGNALVVRVSGQDYAVLQDQAENVRQVLRTVEGVISPEVEPLVSQPTVSVEVDLAAAQLYDLRPGDVRREVSTMVSGLTVGSLYEQQAIFDVVVWGSPDARSNVETIQSLLVHTPTGQPVRLGDVARIDVSPTPTVIAHDGVTRTLDISAEVRGRSADEVARDATQRLRQMTMAHEYRAEVLGDAAERADARWQVLLTTVAAAVLVFLLLQAGTNSWRGAVVLFVTTPLAAAGALLAASLFDGVWSAGALAAVLAVVALTVRQSLVLVRRAQALHAVEGSAPAEAVRAAAREQAPPVLVAVLVTTAAFLPVVVLGGGAGLEMLQPFAVALLFGLVTSTVVVLFVVPSLFVALGALRPPPVVGPDTPDGEPASAEHHGRHERPDNDDADVREEGAVMRSARRYGFASLVVAAGLGVAGCQAAAAGAEGDSAVQVATVEPAADGGPARLTVTGEAVERLRLETAPVAGSAGSMSIPYAAVVYDAEGATWAFVQLEPGVYQRAPITITAIEGDSARLSVGPEPGTEVVTVAAAELVGVEAGISGGE